MKTLSIVILSLALAAAGADIFAQEASKGGDSTEIKLEKIACGSGVADRELTGQDTVFSVESGTIYCWTLFTGGAPGNSVTHVWSLDGKEMARVSLPVDYPRTRTWSSKKIFAGAEGKWRVEVVDSRDSVLAAVEFVVR